MTLPNALDVGRALFRGCSRIMHRSAGQVSRVSKSRGSGRVRRFLDSHGSESVGSGGNLDDPIRFHSTREVDPTRGQSCLSLSPSAVFVSIGCTSR